LKEGVGSEAHIGSHAIFLVDHGVWLIAYKRDSARSKMMDMMDRMIEAITRVLANVDNIRLSPVRESRLRFHGLCPFVYRLLQFAKSAPHETHNYHNYQYKPLPMKHLRKNSGPLLGWQRPGFVPFSLYLAERADDRVVQNEISNI
jgi:hypothetical protein